MTDTFTPKTTSLLPCPFCGSRDLKTGGDDKIVAAWCLNCEATGPNQYGKVDWNTRSSPPQCGVRTATEETEIELLAFRLAGAELNYRNAYEQHGAGHIETGRTWDKMRKAGDAIRDYVPLCERSASSVPSADRGTQ